MPGPGFAVIDFETTGLFPGGQHRVIELAVVHVDPNGEITGQWDTLVNPSRDLGPQHIHRITNSASYTSSLSLRLTETLSMIRCRPFSGMVDFTRMCADWRDLPAWDVVMASETF